MRGKNIALITLLLFIVTAKVYGADVKVTDTKGNIVEVRDVAIDYTRYSIIYTPDNDHEGVRAFQGEGVVTINWSQIETIAIKRKKTDVVPNRLEADVTFKDKRVVGVDLQMDARQGLHGKTDLGDFSIQLESVKSIAVLPKPSSK